MAHYTNELSKFPEVLYQLHHFLDLKDAPIGVNLLVSEIKQLNIDGKYQEAAQKISENITTLRPYFIDADIINTIEEELRNIEIYVRNKKQTIYYQELEPVGGVSGDVWIS